MKSLYDPPDLEQTIETPSPASQKLKRSSIWVTTLILVTISLFFRMSSYVGLNQSSLFYIGIPALLVYALSFAPDAKSALGMGVKGMTYLLLFVGILAVEGMVCILMAAPILYLVVIIVGALIDVIRSANSRKRMHCHLVLVILLLSCEGLTESLSFARDERVVVEKWYPLQREEGRKRLLTGPSFDSKKLPLFLRMGFPLPQRVSGHGVKVGDQWAIAFPDKKGELKDLQVMITEAEEDRFVYDITRDETVISEWLTMKSVTWDLKPDGKGMQVIMTLRYDRELDPAWYFKPLQRYGVAKAGEYMMEAIFGNHAE